ncbi:MAG: hypothetical protein MZV49_19160 [Rhodopseudomonas palustris]|nr:hypothetical protein [Rhodopseudomonas palustris]
MPVWIRAWSGCLHCCGSSRFPRTRPSPAIARPRRTILAVDITSLGFDAEVRPTGGHPAVIAKARGNRGDRPHALFYGHYDVQPVDPLSLWHRPPFEPVLTDHADGRQDHRGARRAGRQRPALDLH